VPYRNKGLHPDKTKLDDNTKLLMIQMKATKYNMTLVNNINLMIIFKPLNQSIANTTHRFNGFYLVSYPPNSRSEKPDVSQMHLAIAAILARCTKPPILEILVQGLENFA
jgi:hypothetical protein